MCSDTLPSEDPLSTSKGRRCPRSIEPPAELAALAALTPGDFAVVRRKAEVLCCLEEPATLAAMLCAECDAKPDRPRAIGFRPQA